MSTLTFHGVPGAVVGGGTKRGAESGDDGYSKQQSTGTPLYMIEEVVRAALDNNYTQSNAFACVDVLMRNPLKGMRYTFVDEQVLDNNEGVWFSVVVASAPNYTKTPNIAMEIYIQRGLSKYMVNTRVQLRGADLMTSVTQSIQECIAILCTYRGVQSGTLPVFDGHSLSVA